MGIFDGFASQVPDIDPQETTDWIEAFDEVVQQRGKTRARYLLNRLLERANLEKVGFPVQVSTHYVNTIPSDKEPEFPGDEYIERRIRAYIRWNAAVMVTRANILSEGIGGHLATYASSASLYEVGFNHFFRRATDDHPGDMVFYQGHATPGIYARGFLEGRFSEEQLDNFRRETGGNGLSSYPHPRLMPELWSFPTVSMGLGPLASIYQARFNRYLHHRGLTATEDAKVWCFVGDGESDEPETLGSISLAAREHLDNLIWVVNCNLQRLDGPVRGNGKIIQELEAMFRGAGWNVIKVIWDRKWDELLAKDVDGVLVNKMDTTVDGEFQKYATESGTYIREHFFGPDPRLQKMVEQLSDDDLRKLGRGGHDYRKVYAAYRAAVDHDAAPTVILAKTIKGWTLGPDIEARNVTHQIKKMSKQQLLDMRERLYLQDEIPEEALDEKMPPYYRPPKNSPEMQYLLERRHALGGFVPRRVVRKKDIGTPGPEPFDELFKGSGKRAASTTMAFTGLLRGLMRDKQIGKRIVPIIPDEARTFGMDPLFTEFGIYAFAGQKYEPVDAGMLLTYKESMSGQILEEGITEAGSMASMQAAGISYATWAEPTIPFFIFYSMFGFQRVGDLVWQFGDARGRGFMLGGTAGRTTLNGEGLQHEDGHSHVLASTVPNLKAYDPAFAYEIAAIVREGIARMYGPNPEDIFYYLTLYNENYTQPPKPDGVDEDILRGLYRYAEAPETAARRATILFSGTAWQAALNARDILAADYDVAAECWSATSYKCLREDALSAERWNRLNPGEEPRVPFVTETLSSSSAPVVAVTDFLKAVPDMVSRWVPQPFIPLGTDGYGRSDTRAALRAHFEVDAENIVVSVLQGLAQTGEAKPEEVAAAIKRFGLDPDKIDPRDA